MTVLVSSSLGNPCFEFEQGTVFGLINPQPPTAEDTGWTVTCKRRVSVVAPPFPGRKHDGVDFDSRPCHSFTSIVCSRETTTVPTYNSIHHTSARPSLEIEREAASVLTSFAASLHSFAGGTRLVARRPVVSIVVYPPNRACELYMFSLAYVSTYRSNAGRCGSQKSPKLSLSLSPGHH